MNFLIFAVLSSAAGITLVLWRHNRAVSLEDGMEEFTQGLRAIAPPRWTEASASRGGDPEPATRESERE